MRSNKARLERLRKGDRYDDNRRIVGRTRGTSRHKAFSDLNTIAHIFEEELFVKTYMKHLHIQSGINRLYKCKNYYAFALKLFIRLLFIIVKDMIDNYNQFEFEGMKWYIGKGSIKIVRRTMFKENHYAGVDWEKQGYKPNQFKIKYVDKEGCNRLKWLNIPKSIYKYLIQENKIYIKE
jgi:hypothetical protein